MKKLWWVGSALLLSLPLVYNACGVPAAQFVLRGTEITNPMSTTNTMAASLCKTIQRCHTQASSSGCFSGVMSAQGMGAPLGLSAAFDTLALISVAESSGTVVGNASSGSSCSTAIENLACGDTRVAGAFDSNLSNPYAGATNMISGNNCGTVFVTKAQYSCPTKVFLTGKTNTPITPSSAGGMTYSISPALPTGLSIDTNAGIISGTPTVLTPMTVYTVTASSSQGSVSETVNIKTADGFFANDYASLITAVQNINGGAPETDVVLSDGPIVFSSRITITSNINIYGGCSGQTVLDGQSTSSMFWIQGPNLTVSMNGLKFQNGSDPGGSSGGLSNDFFEGDIFNGSHLTFYNNKSNDTCGAAATWWGPSSGEFHCSDCVFDSNTAPTGGTAADPSGATGGVFLVDARNSFDRSLFVNNVGRQGAVGDNATIGSTYTNSTFYNNRGTIGSGGIWMNDAGSVSTFTNLTFVNNDGVWGGAIDGGGQIHISNSILYNNTGSNGDCDRALMSGGGNLSTATASRCDFNQATDVVGTPMFGPLENNGGFSFTLALLSGSPGIDQGVALTCPAVDQRGLTRPARASCDIGAFEVQ